MQARCGLPCTLVGRLCIQTSSSAHLLHHKAPVVAVLETGEFLRAACHHLPHRLPLLVVAVEPGLLDDVAGDLVPGQAADLRGQDLGNRAAVLGLAMLQEVLDHVVAIGVPGKVDHIPEQFHGEALGHPIRAMLKETLQDAAAERVLRRIAHVALDLGEDEADVVRGQHGHALLEHVVRMRRPDGLQDVALERVGQRDTAGGVRGVHGGLHDAAAVPGERQRPGAADNLLKYRPLQGHVLAPQLHDHDIRLPRRAASL
mmetsp:Transcript_29532/g.97768  ORF Transcript_29532/g.97768 Transcript_29532/m.97768 type:complete len:258 (+) Transcript_29532:600-1373(+)